MLLYSLDLSEKCNIIFKIYKSDDDFIKCELLWKDTIVYINYQKENIPQLNLAKILEILYTIIYINKNNYEFDTDYLSAVHLINDYEIYMNDNLDHYNSIMILDLKKSVDYIRSNFKKWFDNI